MKINKKITYTIESILLIALIICAFFISRYTQIILAIITLAFAISVSLLLRKEPNIYANSYKIKKTLIAFGVIYILLFYTIGIYTGFTKSLLFINIKNLIRYIIPITTIIVSTEIIRNKLLNINSSKSKIIVLIITILIDVLMYANIYDIKKLNDFLSILGFLTFSSISSNLLYNYLNPRFGKKNIIIYRLITTLYLYFIPITPNVYIFLRTFFRIVFPLLIYLHIENYYNPDKAVEEVRSKRRQVLSLSFTATLAIIFIALISCRFAYGVLVIGSGSMTGAIDKGDVIVYKNVKDNLKEGDIIVFNKEKDDGFVLKEQILGKVEFRIRKIGKPTIWLHEQFE